MDIVHEKNLEWLGNYESKKQHSIDAILGREESMEFAESESRNCFRVTLCVLC